MTLETVVLVVAGTLTGLLAGVFFAFNVAVVPSLLSINGKAHIAAMQAINVKIINPIFMLSFLGPIGLLPLAAFLYRDGTAFPYLVAAAVLHIVGAVGVTGVGNVPLNDKLAKVDINAISEAEADKVRLEYQGAGSAWMRWHNVRTVTSIAATALVFVACLVR